MLILNEEEKLDFDSKDIITEKIIKNNINNKKEDKKITK